MYLSICRVDALVGFPSLCIHKLPIDEELVRYLDSHVVHVLLHLCTHTVYKLFGQGETHHKIIRSSRTSVPKLGYAYPQGYAKWFRGYAGRKCPR